MCPSPRRNDDFSLQIPPNKGSTVRTTLQNPARGEGGRGGPAQRNPCAIYNTWAFRVPAFCECNANLCFERAAVREGCVFSTSKVRQSQGFRTFHADSCRRGSWPSTGPVFNAGPLAIRYSPRRFLHKRALQSLKRPAPAAVASPPGCPLQPAAWSLAGSAALAEGLKGGPRQTGLAGNENHL